MGVGAQACEHEPVYIGLCLRGFGAGMAVSRVYGGARGHGVHALRKRVHRRSSALRSVSALSFPYPHPDARGGEPAYRRHGQGFCYPAGKRYPGGSYRYPLYGAARR